MSLLGWGGWGGGEEEKKILKALEKNTSRNEMPGSW